MSIKLSVFQCVCLSVCLSTYSFIHLVLYSLDTAATLIIEAHQSSTNGSFVAGLAFDGILNTFSLTNDGANQSWSATLVKPNEIAWIFVRIKTGIRFKPIADRRPT